ncbi:hypothetical protein J4225_04415 [Candidatus Pacearchaeota archaeon]|nr:hypothetical protein [Candidatus Pacearchaeota archaeon]
MTGINIFGRKISKKRLKKETITRNRIKGKAGEEDYMIRARLMGYDPVRTGKGHDYKLYKTDPFTGEKRFIGYRKIKTGKAVLSKLQRKTKAKTRRYKVIRENPLMFD